MRRIQRIATKQRGHHRSFSGGSECWATPVSGLGTPRFSTGTPDFISLLDAFDETSPQPPITTRQRLATELGSAAAHPRDTLALWHLLDDPDATIRNAAEEAVVRMADLPPQTTKKTVFFTKDQWREHLEAYWK